MFGFCHVLLVCNVIYDEKAIEMHPGIVKCIEMPTSELEGRGFMPTVRYSIGQIPQANASPPKVHSHQDA